MGFTEMVNRDCLNPMDKKENCKLFRAIQLWASVSGTVEGQIIFAVVAKPFLTRECISLQCFGPASAHWLVVSHYELDKLSYFLNSVYIYIYQVGIKKGKNSGKLPE